MNSLPNPDDFYQKASGSIYHSLSSESYDYIIWFRPESLTEVNWAGDPKKTIVKDGKGLYPKKLF